MLQIEFYPFSEESMHISDTPSQAKHNVPEWYRKHPSYHEKESFLKKGLSGATIKKCMPIFDSMTAGYMLYAPMDIHIDASNPEGISQTIPLPVVSLKKDLFSTHAPEQFNGYPLGEGFHKHLLRINPLWFIKTPKGYSCLFTKPMHQPAQPFEAIPGIIDTDSYISEGFLSFKVKSGFVGVIEKGTPLVQVIPFKRESWTSSAIEIEQAQKELRKQRMLTRSTFFSYYKNNFWHKKEWN